MFCGGMLLRERDAPSLGRGVSQSAGKSDYGNAAERAAGADTVIRGGGGVWEFRFSDVVAEAAEV